MSFTMFSPQWFFGYDVALEMAFAIITFMVALFAFKVYRMTDQRPAQLFGFAFMLLSLSYIVQSIMNFLIISKVHEQVSHMMLMRSVLIFDTFGIYAHIILSITGFSLLAYMTFHSERARLFLLLASLSLLTIFLAQNTLYIFFLVSSLLLVFITWHHIENYMNHRDPKVLLIVIAFLLLLFSEIHFLISVDHQLFYVVGHAFEFTAYVLILFNFYLVHKHGQKTGAARDHPRHTIRR
jgi:hypothetical protein